MFADRFAGIALAVSARFGGPYWDAVAVWEGAPVKDDGGSIVTPGNPIEKPCSAQVDKVTDEMRREAGYIEKDVRLLVLASTLDGALDADATVNVTAGPHAGSYRVHSITDHDPLAIYWQARARPV